MSELKYGFQSDIGKLRENNEDGYLASGNLFAVADGMGGQVGGEVASRLALETLAEDMTRELPRVKSRLTPLLKKSFSRANRLILEKSLKETNLRGMGTTLTALVVSENKTEEKMAYVAHIGDSRAYLLRTGKFTQLTEDHSVVAQMVREGKLSPEEAEVHPLKSVLTRALGTEDMVEVDVIPLPLETGDKILLCTDGLPNMLSDDEIRALLEKEDSPQDICDELVRVANDRGGIDNVTVVIVARS